MICYKLVRKMRDGSYRPLFIDKKTPFVHNEWVGAECHPTNGFAVRKGFHLCLTPNAPHLKERLSSGERRDFFKTLKSKIATTIT